MYRKSLIDKKQVTEVTEKVTGKFYKFTSQKRKEKPSRMRYISIVDSWKDKKRYDYQRFGRCILTFVKVEITSALYKNLLQSGFKMEIRRDFYLDLRYDIRKITLTLAWLLLY